MNGHTNLFIHRCLVVARVLYLKAKILFYHITYKASSLELGSVFPDLGIKGYHDNFVQPSVFFIFQSDK